MKLDAVKILATFFGIGYLPYCPGTWASLAGVFLYILLNGYFIVYLCLTVAVLVIGFFVSQKAETRFGQNDSPLIVIDELAAILILLIFVPKSMPLLFLAFLVFRAMDILKPFPIKKIENLSGSWGIMGDDLVAGFYTVVIVRLVNIFLLLGGNSG